MRYIRLSDEKTCQDLSRALWRIARPAPVAEADNDVSQYLFGWHKHPTLGQWALAFDESYQYARHPDVPMMLTAPGDPYGSQALMQSLFLPIAADGANSLQALLSYILAHDVIDTGEILPLVDPALVKTKAQMDAAGWFPTQVMP
jgi:hypothetical protein